MDSCEGRLTSNHAGRASANSAPGSNVARSSARLKTRRHGPRDGIFIEFRGTGMMRFCADRISRVVWQGVPPMFGGRPELTRAPPPEAHLPIDAGLCRWRACRVLLASRMPRRARLLRNRPSRSALKTRLLFVLIRVHSWFKFWQWTPRANLPGFEPNCPAAPAFAPRASWWTIITSTRSAKARSARIWVSAGREALRQL